MSEEDVEVVRRSYERGGSGELPFECWHPDAVIENVPDFPITGPYFGHAGLAQWRADIAEVVKDLRIELLEVIDAGPRHVVSVQRASGRARHTDLDVNVEWAALYRLENGQIVHAWGYRSKDEALEAAGLSE
jgi:ketosteroid isomerase-like protein